MVKNVIIPRLPQAITQAAQPNVWDKPQQAQGLDEFVDDLNSTEDDPGF
jgi:hypothetical protein